MDARVLREQAVRDAKSNLILDAARKVFSKKDYSETRLEDIAEAAGFSKASLYNYYKDKDEIFISLALKDFDELLFKLKTQFDPRLTFAKNFEIMLRTIFLFFGSNYSLLLTFSNFRVMNPENFQKIASVHENLVRRYKMKFAELLEINTLLLRNARKKGEIRTSIPEAALSGYIASLIRGVIFEWRIRGGMNDVEREIRQIVLFMENGLSFK